MEGPARGIRQNQKVQRRKREQEEGGGAGDCDDLLIHGQRWAGGRKGWSWIGSIMKLI